MKQTFARTRNGYANSQLRTNYPKSTTGRNMHVCNVSMFRCSDGLTRANPPSVSRLRGSGRWSLGILPQAGEHTYTYTLRVWSVGPGCCCGFCGESAKGAGYLLEVREGWSPRLLALQAQQQFREGVLGNLVVFAEVAEGAECTAAAALFGVGHPDGGEQLVGSVCSCSAACCPRSSCVPRGWSGGPGSCPQLDVRGVSEAAICSRVPRMCAMKSLQCM